jgi:deoxyinosine 3'endonuclease (endonuclease V)
VILAVDVHYEGELARAAGIAFAAWTDETERSSKVIERTVPADYKSGHFYERELPCILPIVRAFLDEGAIDCVIVDGYVDLGPERPGLGRALFEALDRRVLVVGVAKTEFLAEEPSREPPARAITRGESKSPIFVTSTGDVDEAATRVRAMSGSYRIPALLKRVDRLSRGDA